VPHLQKQFAVIGIDKRVANDGLCAVAVKRGVVKEDRVGGV
jgi:hypothetical protein